MVEFRQKTGSEQHFANMGSKLRHQDLSDPADTGIGQNNPWRQESALRILPLFFK